MLEVEERREPFEDGEGEREVCFAVLGESVLEGSEPGVEGREGMKGSDFARMRLRPGMVLVLSRAVLYVLRTYFARVGSTHSRGLALWVARSWVAAMGARSQC